jgi:hypothetical protein
MPHETITTQSKNLINRAKKFIAIYATAPVTYLRANDIERIPIGVGGTATTANTREPTKGRGEPSVSKVKRARQTKRCNFSKLRKPVRQQISGPGPRTRIKLIVFFNLEQSQAS